MKLFRKMRNTMENTIDNESGMDRFNGEVFDLDTSESKTMQTFVRGSDVVSR